MTNSTVRHSTALMLALLAAAASAARGQQLPAITMPLKDGGTDHWEFYGDKLMGVDVDRGVLKLSARINTYSLSEAKPLWRQEFDMGYKMNEVRGEVWFQSSRNRVLVGTGPMSAVTLDGKSWTLSCDQAGPVDLGEAVQLDPDHLLIFGNDSCKDGFKDDPQLMLLDGATGRAMWTHKSKGQWFDAPMGYWARVAAAQGAGKQKVLQFRVWPLVQGANGYESGLNDQNRWNTARADRVLVIGKYMEVLNVADGAVLYRSPKQVERLEGLYGRFVFLRDGDKLSAVKAGTGETAWTMDLDKEGTTLYGADDLVAQGDTSPLGPTDLLVSESRFVNRVDLLTGQKKWTVKREGQGWHGALNALMVTSENQVAAYDWDKGALLWQLKDGRYLHALKGVSGPTMLLLDRGKREDGEWVGPYKFVAVDQATGRMVWSRADLGGKKISSFALVSAGIVAMTSEAGQLAMITIADGSAVSPSGGAVSCIPAYVSAVKALQCRTAAGDVAWERKGEVSEKQEPVVLGDLVIWAAKSGDIEVIGRPDGASRWKTKVGGNPRVWVSDDRTQLVVPGNGSVSVVRLGS